ncbi:hypothetical protein MTO96_014751 [Rhipicephalus appendiculatus]
MDRTLPKMLIVALAFLVREGQALGKQITYPEARSDLQKYQDVSKVTPIASGDTARFSISADVPLEDFYVIFVDCESCIVIRHRYADNGFGCSLWRRKGTLTEPNDYCEFIYDENCGSTPKYSIYEQSCDF